MNLQEQTENYKQNCLKTIVVHTLYTAAVL